MKQLAALTLLLGSSLSADARLSRHWTYQDLYDTAALVVIAEHLATADTAEQPILPHINPAIRVIGQSSTFLIDAVFKGDKGVRQVVLHHYRLLSPPSELNDWMLNGPSLVSFDSDGRPSRYLLFLVPETDGRYSAVSGQVDPQLSVVRIDNHIG